MPGARLETWGGETGLSSDMMAGTAEIARAADNAFWDEVVRLREIAAKGETNSSGPALGPKRTLPVPAPRVPPFDFQRGAGGVLLQEIERWLRHELAPRAIAEVEPLNPARSCQRASARPGPPECPPGTAPALPGSSPETSRMSHTIVSIRVGSLACTGP
jgi:hypothetical protein